jgi:hypothetical protein
VGLKIIITLFLLPLVVRGQDGSSFININSESGLPSSECYHVMQDSKGYIWISTDRGVVKYAGKEMQIFTKERGLTDNTVFSTYEDIIGRIWFRTYNGNLSYYHNDSVYGIKPRLTAFNNKRIISKLCVDENGDLWFTLLGKTNFYRIRSSSNFSKIESIPYDSNFVHVKKFNDGQYLFAFTQKKKNQSAKLKIEPGNKEVELKSLDWGMAANIAFYNDNQFVLSTNLNDVLVYKNGTVKTYSFPSRVIEVFKEGEDALWVSVYKAGVYKYDVNDLSRPLYHLLGGSTVTSFFRDFEGGYWFSTRENGIYYKRTLDNVRLRYANDEEPSTFRFVEKKNERLFIGTDKPSLISVDQAFNVSTMTFTYTNGGDLNAMEFFGDKYYLSSFGALRTFDLDLKPGRIIESVLDSTLSSGKNGNFKQVHFIDKDRFVYNDGFNILLVQKGKTVNKTTLPYRANTFFYDDKERKLFIGTKSGLFISNNFKTIKPVDHPDLTNELIVKVFRLDELTFAICTQQNGVFLYDGKEFKKIFTQKNGLINDISPDDDNNLWLATSNGIQFLKKDENDKWRSQRLRKPDGLQSNGVNHVSYFNHMVWYTTNKGVYYFSAVNMLNKDHPPKIEMEELTINDKHIDLRSIPKLEHNENNLNFKAAALSYLPGEPPKLSYRLVGYDTTWRNSTGQIINYTNLSPGKYTLQVKSSSAKGTESAFIRSVKFEIKKPFWLEWWFISLEIIILTSLIAFFVYLYIKRIRKKADEKTKLNRLLSEYQMTALRAQIKPHFIFNCISSIQTMILKEDIQKAYEYLQKFSKLLRLVLENSKRNFISLKEELEVVDLYIELEQLRFDGSFTYIKKIDYEINTNGIDVPYLILQPVIENAIWHGLLHSDLKEKKLQVNIKDEGKLLVIQVEDNGIGREQSKQYHRNVSKVSMGQSIVSERLNLIASKTRESASVEITDLYDANKQATGTLVTLQIPYN